MDYKGNNNKDNGKDNKIINIFNTLVVNIDFSTLLDKDNQAIVYYTLYSEIKLDNATTIALKLANRVCNYVVIIINTTIDIFPTNTALFIYNITLYYTSTKFMGIIINTRTSKYSIVGYS